MKLELTHPSDGFPSAIAFPARRRIHTRKLFEPASQ